MGDVTRSVDTDAYGPGTRSVCDLGLQTTLALPADTPLAGSLEPGDIILCRNVGGWLGDLIAGLDGYWTHSALYCGDSRVVHAYTAGVGEVDLETFVAKYPVGVGGGPAEPNVSGANSCGPVRSDLCAADPETVDYSGWDLGVAFAALRRARARGGWRRLPPVDGGLESMERLPGGEGKIREFSSTCSGLVYRSYREGSRRCAVHNPGPGAGRERRSPRLPRPRT